jgi:hypothetical protein
MAIISCGGPIGRVSPLSNYLKWNTFPYVLAICSSKTEIDHIPNLDSHTEREIEKESLSSSSVIMDCNEVGELSATAEEEDFVHDS